jgi:hypothetical protein
LARELAIVTVAVSRVIQPEPRSVTITGYWVLTVGVAVGFEIVVELRLEGAVLVQE